MATDRDRASFEHWHIQRQRSRGYGAFLSDAEFVTRDESGRYRTLGLDDALEAWCAALASAPAIEPVSPMAKMAQALRDKAAAEKASFDTRVQSGEWGPAPDAGTEADCQLEHVAQVEGDAVVRTLRWNKNVGAFEYPVGTKLYAASAPLASAPAAPPVEQQALGIPTTCDGLEQVAFETWAKSVHFDMREHPIHYLFLDGKTDSARHGWKAGLRYAAERVRASAAPAEPAQPAPQAGAAEPVAGQARMSGGEWGECTVEHVAMVLAAPDEWKGYEVRYLYAAHPTELPSQDAERWRFVLDHAVSGKAPKDKGFDITYVPVGHNGSEWGRIEIEWRGAKWGHITADGVNAIIDAARAAQAQAQGEKGTPHG